MRGWKEGAAEASIHLMLQKLRETLTVLPSGSRYKNVVFFVFQNASNMKAFFEVQRLDKL